MRRKEIYSGITWLVCGDTVYNGRIDKNFFLIALDESECCRNFP